jgi:hypothetical protein
MAMLVGGMIVTAASTLFATGIHSSLAAEREAQMVAAAQLQIEAIRQAVVRSGFASLAMKTLPAKAGPDTDPSNPTDFITPNGTNFEIEENYNAPGSLAEGTPATGEAMIVSAGGTVTAIQTNVPIAPASSSGAAVTGTVYTFVTQVTDVCNTTLPTNASALCSGAGATSAADADARRVVVAVKLDQVGGTRDNGPNAPQYLTTIITNPTPSNQVNSAAGLRIGLNVS